MTQEWDDILSEPVAQLHPDLPAADGGWRAVRSIEEVSPRPQQPPLTLPNPDGMLSVRLPIQPETTTPASEPAPSSLTDQLSLTWASRRRGRRPSTQEPGGENWPEWEPAQPSDGEELPSLAPSPILSWRNPLRSLLRLLRRETPEGEAEPEPRRAASPKAEVEASQSSASVSMDAGVDAPRERLIRQPSVEEPRPTPLVHAQGLAHHVNVPRPEAPVLQDMTAPHRPAQEEATAPTDFAPPGQPETVFRRWLRRSQPAEATRGPASTQNAQLQPEPPFEPVPLVERHEHAESPRAALPEAPADPIHAGAPSHLDEGEPLPPVLRERMEKLLDVPLNQVRVFRNSVAHATTHAHGADALAVGTEVHLAPGQGDPSTPSGQALLAHELSHVAAHITGRDEHAHLEEQHAQAIEHSIRAQPDIVMAPRTAAALPGNLEHRAQPRSVPIPPAAAPVVPSYSGGGFVGGDVSDSSPSAPAVHLAPVGRIPAVADSALGLGGTGSMARPDSGGDLNEPEEPPKDELGSVDRIVEAVMRRLRREGSLERERRGAFRSEIGG